MTDAAEPDAAESGPRHKITADLLTLATPIGRLRPLPGNPRRGHVAAIARSLERFGQRKPIVANADGTVEAGNHTLLAARRLGWSHLAVSFETDDDSERDAYALADNRVADRGAFDPAALAVMAVEVQAADPQLLTAASVVDLAAMTGRVWTADPAVLLAALHGPGQDQGPGQDADGDQAIERPPAAPPAGPPDAFPAYDEDIPTDYACPACGYTWSGKTGQSPPEPAEARISAGLAGLARPIGELRELPGNPRRGDVEAIAASLARFGQRKPVVAGPSGAVLAGNHTLLAARDVLGWQTLAVVGVDDDDATGHAYALADNATGALSRFDTVDLAAMVGRVWTADPGALLAAAFDGGELTDLSGGEIVVPPPPPRTQSYTCPKCDHAWSSA